MAQYISLSERIQNLEDLYSVEAHEKTSSGEIKYTVECKVCGTEYKKTYSALMKGCTKCANKQKQFDKFQKKIDQKFGENIYQVIEYNGSDSKAKVRCLSCDTVSEFRASDINRKSYICEKCKHPVIAELKSGKTTDYNVVVHQIPVIYRNIKIVDAPLNIKSQDIIEFNCSNHGNFKKEASHLIESKHPCPKCSKELQVVETRVKNYKKLIQKSKEKFKDKFEYKPFEKSGYQTNRSKISLFCNHHNIEFECEAESHLKSPVGACPKCSYEYNYSSNNNPLINDVNDLKSLQEKSNQKFGWYTVLTYNGRSAKCKFKCNKHNVEFEISPYDHLYSESGSCPKCYYENNVGFKKSSKTEKEIVKYVAALLPDNIDIKENTKIIPDGNNFKELDLYIPDFNFAIEYHGIMFHSFGESKYSMFNNMHKHSKHRYDHKYKADWCANNGINLLQIFENEWLDPIKQDIWKSIIHLKLGLIDNTIYARKCKIKEIEHKTARKFLNENHLQGHSSHSSVHLGLYHNEELVSVMTFGKPRYQSNCDYELIRFASKKYTIITGGASKLLKYFIRKYNPKSIISYANRRWSNGNLYRKLGFSFIHTTQPEQYFVDQSGSKIYSNSYFKIHKIEEYFKSGKYNISYFNPELTAFKNMIKNGYRIIYDAGNYVFEL